jgi:hypothetical protein
LCDQFDEKKVLKKEAVNNLKARPEKKCPKNAA